MEKLTKAQVTRQHLVDTTVRLLRQHGFEATTMRMLATEAGVSVGNAYHHFPSKDHLVQAYYAQSQDDHVAAVRPVLDGTVDFEARLGGVLRARIDTMMADRAFAGSFLRVAADPRSPLSPFSEDSRQTREEAIAIYREAVDGSDLTAPTALKAALPELLWLYSMGVILFWVHDDSPGARRSYALVDRTVPMVSRMIGLTRFRVVRSTVDDVLAVLADLTKR